MAHLYPSLLGLAAQQIAPTITHLEPYCTGFHIDVMDNNFVPNTAFDSNTTNHIDAITKSPLWVHLMVQDPLAWCKNLSLKKNSLVSFHAEASKEMQPLIDYIQKNKWRASIAIKPKTAIREVIPFLHLTDHVLVMSVEPGFSGQPFLASSLAKVIALQEYRRHHQLPFTIGIDGGITAENIQGVCAAGVTDIAIASAIFGKSDPLAALQRLSQLAK